MRAALLAHLDDFAIVPVGASAGTLPAISVARLIAGFMKALQGAGRPMRVRGFTICETDRDRFREIRDTFYQLLRTPLFEEVEVTLTETEFPPAAVRAGITPLSARGPEPVYLLVREELDGTGSANVVGAVLTSGGKAAIYRGRRKLDAERLQQLLAKVSEGSGALGELKKFGTESGPTSVGARLVGNPRPRNGASTWRGQSRPAASRGSRRGDVTHSVGDLAPRQWCSAGAYGRVEPPLRWWGALCRKVGRGACSRS